MGLSESKFSNLLENSVAEYDTQLLKNLVNEKRYELKYLEGALVKAAQSNNVDAVELLLAHVESDDRPGTMGHARISDTAPRPLPLLGLDPAGRRCARDGRVPRGAHGVEALVRDQAQLKHTVVMARA